MTAPEWGQTWPSKREFARLAPDRRVIPVVRRILADDLTPIGIYRRLAHGRTGSFILESAEADGAWHRWSFVGVRTQATLIAAGDEVRWLGDVPVGVPTTGAPMDILTGALEVLHTEPLPGLPPLTGGLVGAIGWDASWYWDPTLPKLAPDELGLPDVVLQLVADMVAVDHHDGSAWLIANAINTNDSPTGVEGAYTDAVARLDRLAADLVTTSVPVISERVAAPEQTVRYRTDAEVFEANVASLTRAITAGEAKQVVLSQRMDLDCTADPLDVYRALRTINPSSYMYLLHLPGGPAGEFHVVGASPETLVKVLEGNVTTFPIAGSRPRGETLAQDREIAEELLADEKEVSEHVMLVDLAQEELGLVCDPASVAVEEYMQIRRFSHIMHITSTVTGQLRDDVTALEALAATFPAGTLSGSPRRAALVKIEELEPARRGIYGGVIGYFDFGGNMDMAIAIRTAVISDGVATVQAGAGIVAQSVPHTEYVETRNKAEASLRAVRLAHELGPVTPAAAVKPTAAVKKE